MGEVEASSKDDNLSLRRKIARILDEVKASNATHVRKLKDLSAVLSKSRCPLRFAAAFSETLTPLFHVQRRAASAERVVRFVSLFAAGGRDPSQGSLCDRFLEEFLRFLLVAAAAANRTARFRACQIISEIIMKLPDDAEVSNEVWDEVIECMKLRVGDKAPIVRTFAVRALSRFVNDTENNDILELFLEMLILEQNVEVRKTVVLALPPSKATSQAIINCTLDVSESVRKAAYCVLANKFPLQSLSIKHRTIILQRGLRDRSEAVSKECLKLMRSEWLCKCCNDDPVELLKYLDVETYESVGESAMEALLNAGLVKLCDEQSIRQHISSTHNEKGELDNNTSIQLMEPEVALYWKTLCKHLQTEAQTKGSDAAATMGPEAVVYAAEASDNNDFLEKILPATVYDYVNLVKAHIDAGANYRFASRQLLLLGAMLDFSDSTSRKVASAFVLDLLHKPLDHEIDDEGNKVVIGDGINLGGDSSWADAVSNLARKVHATKDEFEEVVLGVVQELARPCRERTADFMQWMHCLAVTGLLLENAKSFHSLEWKTSEPAEFLQSLLLPGAKHIHLDVQRASVRCLGLLGLLEKKPSEELVKQLIVSFVRDPAPISMMACRALFDLGLWHGPQQLDRVLGMIDISQIQDVMMSFDLVNLSNADDNLNMRWLDILYTGLDRNDWVRSIESDENETLEAILGEGFAKILLLSENYPSISASSYSLLLAKLIGLYFSNETKDLQRLKQCLSVFFEHYPSLSANHKKYLSKAFVPVIRSMWPGIYGNAGGSAIVVSNMRKRAVQASQFMVHMMQAPLFAKQSETEDGNGNAKLSEIIEDPFQDSLECGEDGLAVRIAAEVASFNGKKTSAEKAYVSALCRILFQLRFRFSEQGVIKLMRMLLNHVAESVSAEKDLVKELKQMTEYLKSVDREPDKILLQDEADLIFRRMELDFNLNVHSSAALPQTPVPPRSSRPLRPRRRVRCKDASSDEETSPACIQTTRGTAGARSQRASKTAALAKMTVNRDVKIDEFDDNVDESSGVTSDEASDDSDHSVE